MNAVPTALQAALTALADDLANVLASEAGGLPCDELARRLGRRRSDVLACLRSDPLFTRSGATNGTRWKLSRTCEATGRNRSASEEAGGLPARATSAHSQNGSKVVTA